MAALAYVSIVLLLFAQAYSCAALRSQKTAWVTNHLHRRESSEARTDRRVRKLLGEATEGADETRVSKGLRGSLIRSTNYKTETGKLTTFEKIRHDVEMSKNRAEYLFGRVRKATTTAPIQKRKLLEDFVSDVELAPGEYSMEISIGNPSQTFTGIADTGSDLVWVQCSQCNPCFNCSANFDPSLSSTYQPVGCGASCDILGNNQLTCNPHCQYTYGYGGGSTTVGDFSSETLWITDGAGVNVSVANFLFGCGLQNAGTYNGINGLVGLGRGPISFPSQIAPHLDNNNNFSYCFVPKSDENAASTILFGENAVPTGMISTTPLVDSTSTFYYVNLNDISVAGSPLSIPSTSFQINLATGDGTGGVIFDSGTSYTMLESVAYQLVIGAFNSSIQYNFVDMVDVIGLDLCYSVPSFDNLVIPNITFNFEGADFNLATENIVQTGTDVAGNNKFICLVLTESAVGNPSIIGNYQQQNFQVLYDMDNNNIGWLPTDCSKL